MQVKRMSVVKMQKNRRLFPLFLLILCISQCNTRFAPRPYYAGQQRQVSYHSELVENMKKEIQKFYGAPYKWGGDSPSGTDCSGMIKTIYKNAANIALPHNAQQIYESSKSIRKIDLSFGDLVFFSSNGRRATHMGLYITDNYFLHASSSRGVVLSKLSDSYYKNQFIGARRIEIY
jgi:cell wall-associated NlpC family hydrolase